MSPTSIFWILLQRERLLKYPKYIFFIGEKPLPYLRKVIEETFKCKTYETYALVEAGWVAFECEEGHLHINYDTVFLDEIKKRLLRKDFHLPIMFNLNQTLF